MASSGSLNFLSASELVSYQAPGAVRIFGIPEGIDPLGLSYSHIPIDFVGLNTNVYEPITASSNLLGHEAGSTGFVTAATSWLYQGGLVDIASTVWFGPALLNGLLLHRNGPYQHPSWKQIRTGENAIARYHRRNNTLSVQNIPTIHHRK